MPVERFAAFVAAMKQILRRSDANILNVAVHHSRADQETLLSWAKTEVYSFVLYFAQGTSEAAKDSVGAWARALIDAALAEGGGFYLPYQLHATREQFAAAYPNAPTFLALKRQADPANKFQNRLWQAYAA